MRITLVDVNNIQKEEFILHRPAGRDDYLFVLFKSTAKVMVANSYVQVDCGNCILFDKHSIQSYFPCPGHKFLHDFMHFDTDNEAEKVLLSGIPMGEVINLSFPEIISDALQDIKREQEREHSKFKNNIFELLGSLFLYRIKNELVCDPLKNVKTKYHYQRLRELREDIYRNPGDKKLIEDVSKSVCLSRYYFQHLYKQFFSVSFQKDLINAKIITAKKLLLNSDLSVKEIAFCCGYQSVEHFVKQFKSEVGLTPGKFRIN